MFGARRIPYFRRGARPRTYSFTRDGPIGDGEPAMGIYNDPAPQSHRRELTMAPESDLLFLHLKLLLLLGVANGVPLLAHALLRRRFARPLDGNVTFLDGRPLLGSSKTIRGVVLALIATPVVAVLFGLDLQTGILIGAFAMLGDLASSFAKRRLGMPSSSQAFGLDQIPESLFPLLAVQSRVGISAAEITLLVATFLIVELLLSRLLFKLRLRDQPY